MSGDIKVFRHELKYYINYNDYLSLSNRLKIFMHQDSYGDKDGIYHVRSMYLDDIYDTSLYEKNYGVYERKKYRIRIYNHSNDLIKLECKERQGDYIHKDSGIISQNEYGTIMNNNIGSLVNREGVVKEFYIRSRSTLLRPKVIVDYYRQAFLLKDEDVRITFDKELSAAQNTNDIFEKNLVPIGAIDPQLVIMEIKYRHFMPLYLNDLIRTSSCSRSAISKYVICRSKKRNIY